MLTNNGQGRKAELWNQVGLRWARRFGKEIPGLRPGLLPRSETIELSPIRTGMIRMRAWAMLLRIKIPIHFLWVAALAGCGRSGPPYNPTEALETFQIEPGFRIELFAAEPDVFDPVAMEFDEDGRIYVVENSGYPLDTENKVGRVRLLEDTDGDGRPDRSTVFAEKLTLPTGVMRWKRGILVTDAPDILYFEDTDGDGRADRRRVVLTGFAVTNPQHTVNGLVYGLDNWIYAAHERATTTVVFPEKFGDPGTDLRFPERPDVPALSAQGRNIRFRPETYQVETLSGSSQFGHAFDPWGHHFTMNNSNHARHEVMAARYLARNPDLALASAMQDLSDHGNAAPVFPVTLRPRLDMFTEPGRMTSACSLTFYLGGAFPPAFHGIAFVAEPAQNLVHVDRFLPSGSTFIARRVQERREFLASTDSWFRPVNFVVGPDGALYLLDYYRPIIEHPEWMASEYHGHDHQHTQELYQGNRRGRIYRIVPEAEPPFPVTQPVRLSQASEVELVARLAHPNVWWRRTAQRLLVDRKALNAVDRLARLFRQSASGVGRLHALWTLEGLGKLDTALIEQALADVEPGVRENAIVLAESRWLDSPRLVAKLLKMTDDSDPKVRFQLLCTLGFVSSSSALAARDRLLFGSLEDQWMQAAALSASSDGAARLFRLAVAAKGPAAGTGDAGRAGLIRQIASLIGARNNRSEIGLVLRAAAQAGGKDNEEWRAASLQGLATGLKRKSGGNGKGIRVDTQVLMNLYRGEGAGLRRAALRVLEVVELPRDPGWNKMLENAASVAGDVEADPDRRVDAVGLLALSDSARWAPLFQKLIDPRQPEPVQRAAARSLGTIAGEQASRFFLSRWRSITPSVRQEAANTLLANPARSRLLLAALEKGEIQSWTLSTRQRNRLSMSADEGIRRRSRSLFGTKPVEREEVLKRYEPALEKEGNAGRGREVFQQVCAQCHRLYDDGVEVGPDLGTVQAHPKRMLLADILNPNQSIAQNYETYVVETLSGRMVDGVLGTQTPTSITLRQEEGREEVILRQEIRRIYAAQLSGMPDDLDRQISVGQMADLLAYLKIAR